MRPRSALLVAVVVLVSVAVTGWGLLRANHETDPGVPWDSYRLTTHGVEVYKLLQSCERITGVDVEETSRRVEITLHVDRGTGCGDVATPTASEVRLDDDLGAREVLDGACIDRAFPTSLCERGPQQTIKR
ncbi:hypothetical protein ACT8ZV_00920 [Nocardioides sp. MAHUQ-72]|uniref:hypothetical protein n=1 Tax=unclassified Nocardioides TaxID=2615069 RepID=UPI003607E1C0